MSYDDFYVHKKNDLFFGEALTEAYKYGEAQDWIGFLLCPSVEEQLEHLGKSVEKFSRYASIDVPFKEGQCDLKKKLSAFIIGKGESNDNSKTIIEKLCRMKERIGDSKRAESIRAKYDRTIEFIVNTNKNNRNGSI
jgi:hypothetical protein